MTTRLDPNQIQLLTMYLTATDMAEHGPHGNAIEVIDLWRRCRTTYDGVDLRPEFLEWERKVKSGDPRTTEVMRAELPWLVH